MEAGLVYDGHTIKFMTERERELHREHRLPSEWVVIVPPSSQEREHERTNETANLQYHQ
jgi:hypothetical protein